MSLTLTRRHNVDRFGYLIPTKYGNLPMVGAVATYRPGEGRFGGAVAVEEGTTNLVTRFDGDFESYTIGASRIDGIRTVYSGTSYEVTEHPKLGKCLYVVGDSGVDVARIEISPYASGYGPANTEITISLYYVKDNAGVSIDRTLLQYTDGTYARDIIWTIKTLDLGGGVLRSTLTGTPAKDWDRILLYHPNGASGWLDKVQVEYKPFATSFVAGTRARGRLEYPQSIWNHATGTFAAWVKTPTDVTTDRVLTLQWASDGVGTDTRFGIRMNTSGRFVVSYGSADTLTTADSYNDGEWHHVVLTWVDGTADIHLYVDGERVASASGPISVNNPGGRYRGVIPIGRRGFSYNDQWWNGLIDELLILPYAASEGEIASWYEAQGPLPPHPQASLQWDRQTVRPAQMTIL